MYVKKMNKEITTEEFTAEKNWVDNLKLLPLMLQNGMIKLSTYLEILKKTKDLPDARNKYYQPELWEFHIGFEYEVIEMCSINDAPKQLQWNKHVLNSFESKFNWHVKNYPEEFRVKYLDKEDIESLGFKFIMTSYDGYWELGNITLGYSYDKRLQIRKGTETIFLGTIKNKSELKRILKQVGIYE